MSTEIARKECKRLTPAERNQVLAKRLSGKPLDDIAAEYDIDRVTVWRICKDLQQAMEEVHQDYRKSQALLALSAVNKGLVCEDDPYKAMEGGIKVLKGLGLYAPDQQNQIAILLNNMPQDMRADLENGAVDGYFPTPEDAK